MKPSKVTDYQKMRLQLISQFPVALVEGFYRGKPAVHLAAVVADESGDFAVIPLGRMYDENEMKDVTGPENTKLEKEDLNAPGEIQ